MSEGCPTCGCRVYAEEGECMGERFVEQIRLIMNKESCIEYKEEDIWAGLDKYDHALGHRFDR